MPRVRRVVLDVLKPHDPELVRFAEHLSSLESVDAVNVAVIEIDREVQNVALSMEGDALDYDAIQETVQELGATVHSVDEVACGDHFVSEPAASLARPTWLR
ncbi:MAG: DUF211 domain-containing protein [Haloplanus sp.]